MAKPLIRDWHLRFNFGGPRSTDSLIGIAIHTTENDPSTPAENVAQYQVDSESGSYNVLADRKGLLLENTDNWITWSTGNKGNSILLHLSFVARASMTRAQWLAEDAMLRHGAWQVAQWCQKYGWPVKHVDVWNLPGITTHDATRAWGGTDHTDPGPNFPWDVFLRYVNEEIAGTPAQAPKVDDMSFTEADRQMLREVHHELTHRFDSRYDLDRLKAGEITKDEVYKDTMIGYALNTDRKIEDLHQAHLAGEVKPDDE